MQKKSKLCILFMTYNRLKYAQPCLKAVIDNTIFSGEIHVHIGDDGSPSGYTDRLREIVGGYKHIHSCGMSNSERGGYGKSYNLATQQIHDFADYILQVEDDFKLVKKLDIDSLIGVFNDNRVGCVRLGYLGTTQELRGIFARIDNKPYWLIDPLSKEPHCWVGHPQLTTTEWQRAQGPWLEGLSPQETEFIMARYIRDGIVWPAWLHPDGDLFLHIGSERG